MAVEKEEKNIVALVSEENDNDFYSSDEELDKGFSLNQNKTSNARTYDKFQVGDNGDEDEDVNASDSDENVNGNYNFSSKESEAVDIELPKQKKMTKSFIDRANEVNREEEEADDDNDDDDQYFGFLSGDGSQDEGEEVTSENATDSKTPITNSQKKETSKKVKKLTAKQLEKEEQKIKKSGVVYLSSLPPYMKPQKLRHVMSRFGEVGRIFLKPEDPKIYKSRIKSGGNKKKKFEEGWVEFIDKANAKLAATTLNGNILGGKKRSFYHDDVMNVKYLKGFKWFDLTNALNREVEVRESKKQAELSQAHKLNKAFIKNVETSKVVTRVKESKKRKLESNDTKDAESPTEIRRNFKQRNVATNRANADNSIKNTNENTKIKSVLNKIF